MGHCISDNNVVRDERIKTEKLVSKHETKMSVVAYVYNSTVTRYRETKRICQHSLVGVKAVESQ